MNEYLLIADESTVVFECVSFVLLMTDYDLFWLTSSTRKVHVSQVPPQSLYQNTAFHATKLTDKTSSLPSPL